MRAHAPGGKMRGGLASGRTAARPGRLGRRGPSARRAAGREASSIDRLAVQEKRQAKSVEDAQSQLEALQEAIHDSHLQAHLLESKIDEALGDLSPLLEKAEEMGASFQAAPEAAGEATTRTSAASTTSKRGLRSDLEWPAELKEFWFPVDFSKNVAADEPSPLEIFGIPMVIFRDERGRPQCVVDQCAHRACPLSLGHVSEGKIHCPYHGWQYDGQGQLLEAPSTKCNCSQIKVRSFACHEKDGCIWVYPGDEPPPPTSEIPGFTQAPAPFQEDKPFTIHAEILMDVPVEHGLLLENLLDLAHAPFTHTSTFAKGWSIPDAVHFHASKLLGGNWEPYPIDMSFEPPCMVLSTIGLMQPGKLESGVRASKCENHLHQLHVCIPTEKGTRLLYRMSLDFMGFMKWVPFVQKLWSSMAEQVLGEDLRLVKGQQDRLSRGGDTWANPVSYDKLGVRYRRWRNSLSSADEREKAEAEQAFKTMSAGELLNPDVHEP